MAAICVFCSSSETIAARYLELAASVGARIGSGGHSLVSGGGRVSMMGAVASAARSHGAHTLGVIPQHLIAYEVADTDADELVIVETMRQRKAHMDDAADAFLILPGGIGTLEEFFEVWTSGALRMHDKPVVVLDLDGFYAPLWDWLGSMSAAGFLHESALERVARVNDVKDAFAILDAVAGRAERDDHARITP